MDSNDIQFVLESICNGELILDTNQLWNNSVPVFNQCFQRTIPVWVPSALLWIFLPWHLSSIFSSKCKSSSIPFNLFNLTRLLVVFLVIVVNVVQFGYYHLGYFGGQLTVADLSYPLLNVFNFTLLGFLLHLHRLYGIHTSGFLWFFSFLNSILTLPTLYMFVLFGYQPNGGYIDYLELTTFSIHFTALFTLFLLNCFADQKESSDSPQCPIQRASFLSMLTCWWVNSLMFTGYRKSLTLADLWPLNSEDSSDEIAPQFDLNWNSLKNKGSGGKSNLIWTIAKTFKTEFLIGALLELLMTIFLFINPQLLKIFLRFISASADHEPLWHGYLIAFLLFLSSSCLSFSRTYIEHIMFTLRLRIRTALTSSIYRKSLSLSNSSRRNATTGEMINYMSSDTEHIFPVIARIHTIWSAPLMAILAVYFLWIELGPAMLAGIAVMLLVVPFTTFISNREHGFREQKMETQDERVKVINEVLGGMKVVKFSGWEIPFIQKITDIRSNEINQIKNHSNLGAITSIVWTSVSFLVSLASFAAYILSSEENILNPAKAFVAMALFEELRYPMTHIPEFIAQIAMALVSVRRVENFLNSEELEKYVTKEEDAENTVTIENGSFSWEKEQKPTLRDINLKISKGSLVALVGHVGSGKSSLLSAILGDTERVDGTVNLAQDESVAYVAQQAWIQNATLRENILFGADLKEPKYNSILERCALLPDLSILPAGDQTEIGEKGINLSGGQKQRVALARACYSQSSFFLLDDPLSAVDSHVAQHIFQKVISNKTGYLKNKTRLLVTNNISILPEVDQIIVLESGKIRETGTYTKLMSNSGKFAEFIREHSNDLTQKDSSKTDVFSVSRQDSLGPAALEDECQTPGKLILAEHLVSGRVSLSVFLTYIKSCTWTYFALTVLGFAATEFISVYSDVWLALWANDALSGEADAKGLRNYRLAGYGLLACAQTSFIFIGTFSLAKTNVHSSTTLHRSLLERIMRSPMQFFDTTPLGRILQRFSKDVDAVDSDLSFNLDNVLTNFLGLISNLGMICFKIPLFVLVIIPTSLLYFYIQKFYISTYRQLTRLKSINKSPVLSHFSETLSGVPTIRAFGHSPRFVEASNRLVDTLERCYYPTFVVNRWLGLRLEFLGNVLVLCAAIFALLAKDRLDGGFVGLIVAYSLSMIRVLNELVRDSTELEKNLIAVERIDEYCRLESERSWTREEKQESTVIDDWPKEGKIEFVDYSVRYRPGLDLVLRDVNLKIDAGEKVGIVGRTGAGKSSLTLALFRILEADRGVVRIDEIDIAKLGLHELRHRLAIIPQDPVLFSGTIRSNLDPFGVYRDELLLAALSQCHMRQFVESTDSSLDYPIAENGSNLSVGQRQLICLGRALLRRTRILVLDEATAAIDLETDALIQQTIRHEFADCTVLTIAHRLATILDSDRVMVLDGGKVAEFDTPSALLSNHKSMFYTLAKDARLV